MVFLATIDFLPGPRPAQESQIRFGTLYRVSARRNIGSGDHERARGGARRRKKRDGRLTVYVWSGQRRRMEIFERPGTTFKPIFRQGGRTIHRRRGH